MRKGTATAADKAALLAKLAQIKAEQEKVETEKKALQLKTETLRRSMSNAESNQRTSAAPQLSPRVPATPSVSAAPSPAPARPPASVLPSISPRLSRELSGLNRELEVEKRKLVQLEQGQEARRRESASLAQEDTMEQMLRKAEEEAAFKEAQRLADQKAKEEEQRREEEARRAAQVQETLRKADEEERARLERDKKTAEDVNVEESSSGEGESDASSEAGEEEEGSGREALQVPLAELQEALRSMASEIAARNDGAIVRLCSLATRKAIQMVEIGRDVDFASSVQMLIVDLNKQIVTLLKSRYDAECLAESEDVIGATLRVLTSGMISQ